jgi:outer membrane receptor protein involved in Fe transport
VESYGDKVRSSAQQVDTLTGSVSSRRGLYPDGASAGQLGIFSLHKLDHRLWQVDVGLRSNFFHVRATDETFGDLSISPAAVVGNAAFIWKVTSKHSAILSYNTGFRSPNIDDLSSFGSFDSGIEVPSPDLKPEHSSTWELGYKHAGRLLGCEVSAYQTSLSDLITRVRSSWQGADSLHGEQVYQKANTAQAVIRGAEARVFFQPVENLTLESSVTYTFGEDLSKAEPLRRIPPIFGRTLLTYRRGTFWGSAEWLYAGAQTRLSGGDIDDHRIAAGGTPGWQVCNVRVGYSLRQLSLSAGAENIFNEAYRMHGSGVDGMGRNAWVAVSWRW